ncbi:MAG TPA: preprotein translocase subunit YajC [Cyclobacteriaceae bacterium]|jgi:preprotein translocase subunit YajC
MIHPILAQANGQGSGYSSIIFFAAIALIFYFFMIRPQQKKQKQQKKFLEEVKKGDLVITIGGLHGKVLNVENDTIVLEVDKGLKLTFEKSSISMEASKKRQTP